MKFNKDTVFCISIAEKPGNFGAKFHNDLYALFDMNWVYLPRKVSKDANLEDIIKSLKSLYIRGCSVSMPHKEKIINYIDKIDSFANKIGAVNTVKQEKKGCLKGYNTDYYGAYKSLENFNIKNKTIFMFGAGGVAKSIGLAIKNLGGNLVIVNRIIDKAIKLSNKLNAKYLNINDIDDISGYLLINATSVGMKNKSEMIVNEKHIKNFEVIMDVVLDPIETKIIKSAKKLDKKIISGLNMCIYQAIKQFEIYTDINLPQKQIDILLEKYKL